MRRLDPRAYLLLAALASGAMLAAAHAFQRFGYEPCLLCLRQREVYWIALPLALGGLALLRREPEAGLVAALLLAAVFLFGFGVAGYHAGVEWRWWSGPESCAAGGKASAAGLNAFLQGAPIRSLRCDEAAWRMLGVSMAGWNALVSLGLAALGLVAARRGAPSAPALRTAHA